MNTFFRITIFLAVAMIAFNLTVAFVGGLTNPNTGNPVFPIADPLGRGMMNETEVLENYTSLNELGLNNPSVRGVFGLVSGILVISMIPICILTRSVTPIGVAIFGSVFWGAFYHSQSIINFGGYIPTEFLMIFWVVGIFIFIAAIIGLLTGGG